MKIINANFPSSNYYSEKIEKKQIVLHHTVSNPFVAEGDINHWKSMTDRIATYAIISYDGTT